MSNDKSNLLTIGWREWVSLPDLKIPAIKAKIDTGAKTSVLHAFGIEKFKKGKLEKVRFTVHPLQKSCDIGIVCIADILDQRVITDSGGHREKRYVIGTTLFLGGRSWPIEITLTNRSGMKFRMLLGRKALHKRVQINPVKSFLTGKTLSKIYKNR